MALIHCVAGLNCMLKRLASVQLRRLQNKKARLWYVALCDFVYKLPAVTSIAKTTLVPCSRNLKHMLMHCWKSIESTTNWYKLHSPVKPASLRH